MLLRKIILISVFLPILAITQKVNEFWITPIANIEFGETKIIYSYSLDECIAFERLKPVSYNSTVMKMKGVVGAGCIDDYKDMLNQLYSYLDEWYYGKACNKDKYNYLKAASLLIIWNNGEKDFLPDDTIEILGYLEKDMSIEISKATKQVLNLYNDFNERKQMQ